MKIVILGVGRVGSFIAKALKEEGFEVIACDFSEKALNLLNEKEIKTRKYDLKDKNIIKKALKEGEIIINALPGAIAFKVLEIAIEEKKPLIDISFMPENPLVLKEKAKEKDTLAIVDIGIAPGLSHFIIGREYFVDPKISGAKIFVGGLPFERNFPFQYKAPFSPLDVLAEYTRKVRFKFNGILTEAEPLTDLENIYVPGIGTLEGFLTDGLRTLIYTTDIPTLIEKTLRYPNHAEAIKILKTSGFLSEEPILIDGKEIIPLQFTSKLLFPLWELKEEDREFTVLFVYIWKKEGEKIKEINYFLIEITDEKNKISSMAKTTGVPAIIMTKLFAEGKIQKKGILAPEVLGMDEKIYENFMVEFEKKGLKINRFINEI